MRRVGLILALFLPAALAAQVPDLRIADARGNIGTVPGIMAAGSAAYPLSALEQLGARPSRTAEGARALLAGDTLAFTAGSPFFLRGAELHHLAFAVSDTGGTLYLPEQFFIEWLPSRYPSRFEFAAGMLRSRAQAAVREVAATRGTRVVILDPGHGGVDPGHTGPGGVREKEITLRLARRLGEVLRERGYEVHLTRTKDTLVALSDRPRLANRWKQNRGAIFVSLHANASDVSGVRGFETFLLSEARTEDERRVAEMENASAAFEDGAAGASEMDAILNGLRNDFYLSASNDLAEAIQAGLARPHGGPDRGVKRAGFVVLIGALMPAVLVEIGFLSNPQEARRLAASDWREGIASGMADAIDRFFEQHRYLWARS